MKSLSTTLSLVCLTLTVPAGEVIAAESGRETPRVQPSAVPAAEAEYSRGIAAKRTKNWGAAAAAFQRAVDLKPDYPEAWNELGFALRNQGKYPDSLKAYDEALRLRPDFPEALEYLGEAYVKLGRMDDARKVLDRLKPLDAGRAAELSEAIDKGK